MTQYSAEEIKSHTKVTSWPLRDCSLCGTWLRYEFNGNDVSFDSNCNCVSYWNPPSPRSWQDVADTVNMQNDEVQKRMLAELAGLPQAAEPLA